ncbi:hypothetical protein [Prochlorococcus marinus]|uniref:hypothetical protein n=1 Tax=Prochlorococcus TaxID=1218 RepID=UPI001F24D5B2|nr:hypothetical protein [Prochlorococcus marinus]
MNIAQAMVHTIEVHLSSYARFTPDATADLYAQVNVGTALEKRNWISPFRGCIFNPH